MTRPSATAVASTTDIRAAFPALERRMGPDHVAYFDGPGGTQVPRSVGEALLEYLYHHNANSHWAYPTSEETDAALEHARAVFAMFLNASPSEIVFGANMTTLTYHIARGIGRALRANDEIVVTELDHHANVAPWTALEREGRATVRSARMDPKTGQLDWTDLERLLERGPKLVAVGAASNALGTVNDVRRIAARAHAVGAMVFVDGVHLAPHALVDVREMDCDFFACSAYKFYGPHVGVLFAREHVLESMDVPRLDPAPDWVPERAETGTLNHEGIVGAAAAVEWLASLAGGAGRHDLAAVYDVLHERGQTLVRSLWEGLFGIQGVQLWGPPPDRPRTPTVAFTVAGTTAREVSRQLASHGLFLSHGDFYAQTVVERLGLSGEGLVRAGCACYTTMEEIHRLVDAVREVAKGQ